MATGATDWVWENSRAQNGSLILLLTIAREIDSQGNCVMTVAELAGKARLSERAVQNAARECERTGDLSVTPRVAGRRSGYALRMAKGAESAPLPASKGADIAPVQNLHPAESAPQRTPKPQVKAQGAESAPNEISDMFKPTTGRSLVAVKDVPAKPPRRREDRPDVDRLCTHLADRIVANGNRTPAVNAKWRDAARLLIDKDGLTEDQVHAAIDWSQDHEFWRANILSMPKLREKYDTLRQQARRTPKQANANANDNLAIIGRFLERHGEGPQ